jgi:uncharacterized membrane protein
MVNESAKKKIEEQKRSGADEVVMFLLCLIYCIVVGGIGLWFLLALPVPTLLVIVIVLLLFGGCSA